MRKVIHHSRLIEEMGFQMVKSVCLAIVPRHLGPSTTVKQAGRPKRLRDSVMHHNLFSLSPTLQSGSVKLLSKFRDHIKRVSKSRYVLLTARQQQHCYTRRSRCITVLPELMRAIVHTQTNLDLIKHSTLYICHHLKWYTGHTCVLILPALILDLDLL